MMKIRRIRLRINIDRQVQESRQENVTFFYSYSSRVMYHRIGPFHDLKVTLSVVLSSLVRLHCYLLWFFLEYFFLCISHGVTVFPTLSVLRSWSSVHNEIQAPRSRIWPILLVELDLWICERRFQKPTNSTLVIRSLPHPIRSYF